MIQTKHSRRGATRKQTPTPAAQRLGGMAGGTQLLTQSGYRAVETLRRSDMVATLIGRNSLFVPAAWVGCRQANTRDAVRIRHDAIAAEMPSRDVLLAPDHAIYVDGTLYRAGDLVNGMSIRREVVPSSMEWWGVRLQRHDVMVAENLPIESMLDHSAFSEVTEPYHAQDGVVRLRSAQTEIAPIDFPATMPFSIRWFRRRMRKQTVAATAPDTAVPRQASGLLPTTVRLLDLDAEARAALAGISELAATHRVQLEIAVQPNLTLSISPRGLHEMLDILLVHAVEATPGGKVLFGGMLHHQRVHLAVIDDGPGQSADVQRADLRRVEEMIALLGGSMEIESRPGEGTTVLLRFPVQKPIA